MTKQEFLEISLPYGLNVLRPDKTILKINGIYGNNIMFTDRRIGSTLDYKFGNLLNCIPILRPLSDLTKSIEYNGERFIPAMNIGTYYMDYPNELEQDVNSGCIWLTDALQLLKWHFDIAGLIEKSEAIDVNTLEVNPYK